MRKKTGNVLEKKMFENLHTFSLLRYTLRIIYTCSDCFESYGFFQLG